MSKRKTVEMFISEATSIHDERYDYSKTVYVTNKTKVCIICPEHGEFWQRARHHLDGRGCPICGGSFKPSINEFIQNANHTHTHKYDYSKVKYINTRVKIIIICPIHGEFKQTPDSHLSGHGCLKCTNCYIPTLQEVILKMDNVHNSLYSYSNVKYKNMKTKIIIICPIHGEFKQTPEKHLLGQGCPICRSSKGELKIANWLANNNIEFLREYTYPNCKNIKKLRFDFYIPKYNTLIEYDGIQHFTSINYFGGIDKLNQTIANDKIKNTFASKNNYNLIRIRYDENVGDILTTLIFNSHTS